MGFPPPPAVRVGQVQQSAPWGTTDVSGIGQAGTMVSHGKAT